MALTGQAAQGAIQFNGRTLIPANNLANAAYVDEQGNTYMYRGGDEEGNGAQLTLSGNAGASEWQRQVTRLGGMDAEQARRSAQYESENASIKARNDAMRTAAEGGKSAIYYPNSGQVTYGGPAVSPTMAGAGSYDEKSGIFSPTAPAPTGAPTTAARPWYENYDVPTLMQLVKTNPAMAALIPAAVKNASFPNEYFIANPSEQTILTPERKATFGGGALGGPINGTPAGSGPVTQPTAGAPGGTSTTQPVKGSIGYLPGGPTFKSPGQADIPLAGTAIGDTLSGKPVTPYQSQGNLPFFSAQSRANMSGSDRAALGTLVNQTGGSADDFFNESDQLSGAPRSGGASYSGGPRVSVRR